MVGGAKTYEPTHNGKCVVTVTGPSDYGDYFLEINDFKSFSPFIVERFAVNIQMKDELGQSTKHTFDTGEQASVEVIVLTNSTSEDYIFSGEIKDSAGTLIKIVNTTRLNTTNAYTNRFTFTLDSLNFSSGIYFVNVNVTKTGDGTVAVGTSFELRTWDLLLKKREINSGFDYEYSAFPEKQVFLDLFPTWRANASIIEDVNTSKEMNLSFIDVFNNVVNSSNSTWNASCGSEGCYQFNITLPATAGNYYLIASVSYEGELQTIKKRITVIGTSLFAQSTDKDGTLKDLFGTNEYVYISLQAKNATGETNLTNASVISVIYMNGSEYTYSQVANLDLVNSSNSDLEWSWNNTSQLLKLDAPTAGGLFNVYITGDNDTAATSARFIINPYDVCLTAKNTPGQAGGDTGYYYVYHFKTNDVVYFELKLTQANNPTGRASAFNLTSSGNGTEYGMGDACTDESSTKQVVNNATISVEKVINTQSGKEFPLNTSETSCQSDDEKGTYTCTITPLGSWDGGNYGVKFNVVGQDSKTSETVYGGFESRAFYLYARPTTWWNKPEGDVGLTIDMYEAGNNWWENVGSGGLSGTVTLQKVEYQGSIGEWLPNPIEYDYNVSNVSTATVTNGRGTITLPAGNAPGEKWKTGYYRAIIQGTDNGGTSDYGYAYFSIKQWEVYSTPVDCEGTSCNSIWNINSRSNVSLYVTINNAGEWGQSGNTIGGAVNITVKKINDCRRWPCSELNSSTYNSTTINVDRSSGWYYNSINESYILNITPLSDGWGTGYWQVVLDVNGTETGSGWFNTIAFYVKVRPTDSTGENWKYSIKNNESMYFNVTTVKSQKGGYYYDKYNVSDYLNTTIDGAFLRTWDSATYESVEYKYPGDFNITIVGGGTQINGSNVLNLTFSNGSWKSGYYWGDLTLKNSDNETANGNMWFRAQPFRVQISRNQYSIDNDDCINGTINIYDPDWRVDSVLNGTYNITLVTERIWTSSGTSVTTYTNVTPAGTFNGSDNFTVCPNGAKWGSGSWSNYHYLDILVEDSDGNKENGWLSFRAIPFAVNWGSISGGTTVLKTNNVIVPLNLSKAISNTSVAGNLSRIYQWRSDGYYGREESYVFSIGSCFSNVSGNCQISSTENVTIYAPSGGWVSGNNYLKAELFEEDNVSSIVRDNSGIWFTGKDVYQGWYLRSNENNTWKYYFSPDENLTIRLFIQDDTGAEATANVTAVHYSTPSDNCDNEGCRVYTEATFSLVNDTNLQFTNNVALSLAVPSSNWTKGKIYIRATIEGDNGTTVIKNENTDIYVKDLIAPVINITYPETNTTFNATSFWINWTTTEPASCYLYILNYDNYLSWYCGGWNTSSNASDGPTIDQQWVDSCNTTKFSFSGSNYYFAYVARDYKSWNRVDTWGWSSGDTGMTTGGTIHSLNYNDSLFSDQENQDYGITIYCNDPDWNYDQSGTAFILNISNATTTINNVTLTAPANNSNLTTNPVMFNYSYFGTNNANCSLYGDFNGSWHLNQTTANVSNGTDGLFYANLSNGSFIWNVNCVNLTYSNISYWGDDNFTFSLNTTYLNVTLDAPTDGYDVMSDSVDFNYTVEGDVNANCSLYGNFSGIWALNTSNNVSNGSNIFNLNLANSNYLWNVYCEDSTNSTQDWGDTNFSFIYSGASSSSSDTTINVTLSAPANNSNLTTNTVGFNYSFTGPSFANCSLYGNFSGSWALNNTSSNVNNGSTNSLNISLDNGTYIWNIYCVDTSNVSNFDWYDDNFTLNFNTSGFNISSNNLITSAFVASKEERREGIISRWFDFLDNLFTNSQEVKNE